MRAVNLIPSDSLRTTRSAPSPVALTAAVTGAVVIVIVAGANLVESSRVSSAQKALNAAQLALASTPPPPTTTPAVTPPPDAVAAQVQPRLSAVSQALGSRIAWDRILREFSLVLPSDIQVDALTLTQPPAGSATTSATGLTLSGDTYSYDAVARLVSRLALIPDLTNVQLSNTAVNQGAVQFSITAGVKGGAPTTPAVTPGPVPTTTTGATS
jgi:Fimbrial assembly protein (PilN)